MISKASPEATVDLSVVVPFFNEEANVEPLLERLLATLRPLGESWEVIAVDDGSSDRTLQCLRAAALREPALRVQPLAQNSGQHLALLEGFALSTGQSIVTLDADLQNPPEEIPAILAQLRAGHDVVGTYRVDRADPPLRKLASRALNVVVRSVSGLSMRDVGCMLRGYSRAVVETILQESTAPPGAPRPGARNAPVAPTRQSTRRRPFLPARALVHARNAVEIPVRHEPRRAGDSKYDLGRLVVLSLDAIRAARQKSR